MRGTTATSRTHALGCNPSALGESFRRGPGAPMEIREIIAACCMSLRLVLIGIPRSRPSSFDFEDLYTEYFEVSIVAHDKGEARMCLHGG